MFNFKATATTKGDLWADIVAAAAAVTDGEPDPVANMANIAAILSDMLPDLNWAGFYRLVDGELVLGPFQGKAACIRIALGKGVCGAAAASGETQLVADVHSFPGHIACDAASRSELVVPFFTNGHIIGVIDLDSPTPARFDEEDAAGCEKLARLIGPKLGQAVNHPS